MFKLIWNKKHQISLVFVVAILSANVTAISFNAYPGQFKAKLINVEAANIINVSVDVWSGYPRNFRVTLPNIVLPENNNKAPACQIALIQKGIDFANNFLTDATDLKVKNLMMENTAEMDALSNIYTDKENLSDELVAEGLARPASVESTKPWC